MAVASLVLGIVGLVFSIVSVGVFGWIGAILGIIGIILGALGRKKTPDKKGIATAGLVLSILALVFGLLLYLACVGFAAGIEQSIS
jgi:hypothetical protein